MFGFLNKKKDETKIVQPEEVVPSTTEAPRTFTNTIGMEFIWIEGGRFAMGRNETYNEGGEVELPSHEVSVDGFWMAKYPVTQEQYFRLTRVNPSYFKNDKVDEENSRHHPVEQINWFDASAYADLMNRYEGRQSFYAIPTESQWEFVAKAGRNDRFTFGNIEGLLDEYAVYSFNSRSKTSPVESKKPNPWGVYSLIGNVWEWCEDDFIGNYTTTPIDGSAYRGDPRFEYFKVRRGGSYKTDYLCLRSSFRGYDRPDKISHEIGMRLVINRGRTMINDKGQ